MRHYLRATQALIKRLRRSGSAGRRRCTFTVARFNTINLMVQINTIYAQAQADQPRQSQSNRAGNQADTIRHNTAQASLIAPQAICSNHNLAAGHYGRYNATPRCAAGYRSCRQSVQASFTASARPPLSLRFRLQSINNRNRITQYDGYIAIALSRGIQLYTQYIPRRQRYR